MRHRLGSSFLMVMVLAAAFAGAAPVGADADHGGATPDVVVAAGLHDALGTRDFWITPKQQEAVGSKILAANQDALSRAVALLGVDGLGDYPAGFSGLVVNPATGTLNVWWQGTIPTYLSALITARVPEVNLVVRPAEFSRNELLSVIERHRADMTGVDLAFPRTDGSGIVLTHARGTDPDAAAIAEKVGTPVTLVVDEEGVPLAGGRQDDTAPHYGGALIRRGDIICSTGFAVLDGIEGRLLSAAHCDTSGNAAWNNGSGTELTPGGGAVSVILSVDSMLINPHGGTRGYIYVDGFRSDNRRAVAGTDTNNEGEIVATGGANSGEHRGLVIINDAYSGNCHSYECTLIVAEGNPGETVVVRGDSGGPVYHTNSGGRVSAKGIIVQGANLQANCPPMQHENLYCYNRVRYHPIRPLLNLWNVSIETES